MTVESGVGVSLRTGAALLCDGLRTAARRGNEFAAGGEIRFLPQPSLQAGRTPRFSQRLHDFVPGHDRVRIEIQSIADARILAAKSASFEVEPGR